MGERILGPQCQVRNWFEDEIDLGTNALTTHRPPGYPHHHHHVKPRALTTYKLPTIVFDEKLMMEFLRTSARAKVMARHISIVFTTPKHPSWGEVITRYALAGGTEEGITSVAFGDESKIGAETRKGLNELIATFNERFHRSTDSGCRFLNEQERERARNVGIVQAFYDEVGAVNRALRHDLLNPLKALIAVKLAATISFKFGSLFVTKGWFFLTGIVYDVSTELISEWDSADKAKLVVMASTKGKKRLAVAAGTEAGVDLIQEGTEKGAETLFKMVENQMEYQTQEGLQSMFKFVAGETAEQAWKRSADAANVFKKAQLGRALGRGISKGMVRGIKGLWFGKDVVLAYWTAKEEWKAAEEAAE